MARIDLEGDSSPDQNYPGGSASFDESAYAQPQAPEPIEFKLPEGRSPWDEQLPGFPGMGSTPTYTSQMRADPYDDRPPQPNQNAPLPSPSGGWDSGAAERAIRDQYQRLGSRAPTADELRTDLEAARRYGLTNPTGPTGGTLGQIAARFNNTPGSGVLGNPFQGWSNPNDPRTAMSSPPGFGPGGTIKPSGGYQSQGFGLPGDQFSDPYTNLLEQLAKNQIQSLTGPNPERQQLMDFLNQQFAALSKSPGYTPDEMAVLNTQALEPIEALRHASQQRELERTARAGYLPTSGITLDQQRQIDTGADQSRTVANRDLAINAINRQGQNRQQAVQYGMQALQLPQQQNAQALDVANTLYQLPRTAMLDAAGIVNASSPQSVISPYIQLQQQQQQAALLQQQQQAAYAQSIGQWLATLFGGGG